MSNLILSYSLDLIDITEVDLPSQTELGIRLQVSRQAINIAAAKLQAAGLGGFYPEHRKRIHKFCKNDETIIAERRAICPYLAAIVTFEEVY